MNSWPVNATGALRSVQPAMVTAVGSTDVVERGCSLIDEIRALTPERGAEEVPFAPDGLTGDGRVWLHLQDNDSGEINSGADASGLSEHRSRVLY